MLKVYTANSNIDAEMVKDHLLALGIEVVIMGGLVASINMPPDATPTVWVVNDDDYDRASKELTLLLDDQQ